MAEQECKHYETATIKMPSLTGQNNPDGCPFGWCRGCGAIWLPEQPKFTKAFERHQKRAANAPLDDITVKGYWVLPGIYNLALPVTRL